MTMAYDNNHYVPQFILRRFGDKLNRYNVKTGDIKIKGSIINAFSGKNIYPEWLEHMLSDLESRIANLIDNKILNASNKVTITRADNWLIKKFFAIAMLRVPESSLLTIKHLDSEENLEKRGFKEVKIENESSLEYAYRTLKVILESKNIVEVYNHPQVTYEACNWTSLFNNCYITIWDSTKSKEDFIITDNGMNCEHDKTRFKTFIFDGKKYENVRDEILKCGYVMKKLMDNIKNEEKGFIYYSMMKNMEYVHANYYLFAVSNTRTIALINPFYRLYYNPTYISFLKETPNVWPTLLSKEAMESNTQTYKKAGNMNDDDLFHYEIKDLSLEDVIIINNMMLDRVYRWMGFDNSLKIARSLSVYSMIPKQFQRNDYDKLTEYLYTLGCDFPKTQKYRDLSRKLTTIVLTTEEMQYVKFFYDSIKP